MTTPLRTDRDQVTHPGDTSAATGTTSPRRLRRTIRRLYWTVLPFVGIGAAVGTWWLATALTDVRAFYLPSPGEVINSLTFNGGTDLPEQSWVTIYETLVGFFLGAAAGLFMATALTTSRTLERATLPLVISLNAVPKVALVPVLLLWLGWGHEPNIVLSALICFFPIMIAAMAGLNSTPAEFGDLARSLSASGWQAFFKVRVPWALPQTFVGLKLGITLAVIGAVVAELRPSSDGLGSVITKAGQSANTSRAYAAILLLMVINLSLFYIVVLIERLALPWARETSARRN